MVRHTVAPENAQTFLEWISTRGGVAVWNSRDLSDPSYSVSTPALTQGVPTAKPHWKVGDEPNHVINKSADIDVIQHEEVKRFRVGIRRGSQGMVFKVTDGGSRRIRKEVDKIEGGSHMFDYESQEAVILRPSGTIPLSEWLWSKREDRA
jgi:hypothetical protein